MKHTLAAILLFVNLPALALNPMPCEKLEYVELRDMTKQEMTEAYCTADRRKGVNERFLKVIQEQYMERTSRGDPAIQHKAEMNALLEAQLLCMHESGRIAAAYKKKFAAKPLACPQ